MNISDRLRNLDVERLSLDEAIELSAFAKILRVEFEAQQSEVPDYVSLALKSLGREIHARQADALEKRLRELKLRREALKPAEKRRQETDDEIAALEAKLGSTA